MYVQQFSIELVSVAYVSLRIRIRAAAFRPPEIKCESLQAATTQAKGHLFPARVSPCSGVALNGFNPVHSYKVSVGIPVTPTQCWANPSPATVSGWQRVGVPLRRLPLIAVPDWGTRAAKLAPTHVYVPGSLTRSCTRSCILLLVLPLGC